jgi:hypothetical protein
LCVGASPSHINEEEEEEEKDEEDKAAGYHWFHYSNERLD